MRGNTARVEEHGWKSTAASSLTVTTLYSSRCPGSSQLAHSHGARHILHWRGDSGSELDLWHLSFSDGESPQRSSIFYRSCIEHWLSRNPNSSVCPMCQQSMRTDQLFKSRALDDQISKVQVRCPNACNWVGTVGDVPHHAHMSATRLQWSADILRAVPKLSGPSLVRLRTTVIAEPFHTHTARRTSNCSRHGVLIEAHQGVFAVQARFQCRVPQRASET